MSAQKNVTMKLQDLDVNELNFENVKLKDDKITFIRYKGEQQINIQFPNIQLKQFGIQPGEKLANGQPNQYYNGEDGRQNIRMPFDVKCAVTKKNGNSNEDEIINNIEILKKLDSRFKSLYKQCGIDDDDKEKYVPMYRKPAKSKSPNAQNKEKFYSIKMKFDTLYDQSNATKKIRTEFYEIDDNGGATLQNTNGIITMEEVEKLVTYNCEICPIVQFAKVWTQASGAWGVTLKLKKIRVKRSVRVSKNDAEFINSDDEDAPVIKKSTVNIVSDDESDDEVISAPIKPTKAVSKTVAPIDSDDESDDEPIKVTAVKPVTSKTPAKKVVEVESSDDDEPIKVTAVTPITSTTKKIAVVESSDDSESEEEVKPVKSKAKAKAKTLK